MIEVVRSWSEVDPRAWDALVDDGSPFLEHAFLLALEEEGCAVPATGWAPRPVLVRDPTGELVAGCPAWLKGHSLGEFVYDHGWANAAERAGIPYYPKLVAAAPFTPVTGRRLLSRPGLDPAAWLPALLDGISQAARGAHGVHLLFDTADEASLAERAGLFPRLQYQFHWTNPGYRDFEDWLGEAFDSKRRNKLRRERKAVAEAVTIEVIEGPDRDVLDRLHAFYTDTCRQFGPWGHVYLTRACFRRLGERWGHRLHAVVARREGRIVAGAFNVVKGDRLYGRYWGSQEPIPFLHFEVCYYAPIAWCIARGLRAFEPGHGGEHKYRRGFVPTITRSSHRLADPRLHAACEDQARREAELVRREVAELGGDPG